MPLGEPLASPLGAGIIAVTTEPFGHALAAINHLAFQFRDRPNIVALIDLLASEVDNLETALTQLQTIMQIRASSGAQLDLLGRVIGEPRQGFDDAAYQLHLLARVWLNRGSGTGEDLLKMFGLLLPGYALALREYPPASFLLAIGSTSLDTTTAGYLVGILQLAKAAGVRAFLQYLVSPATVAFTFDGGLSSPVGFENGTWTTALG
jgi:hypothetical protein